MDILKGFLKYDFKLTPAEFRGGNSELLISFADKVTSNASGLTHDGRNTIKSAG